MNKCLKIMLSGDYKSTFLSDVIQKYAKKTGVEGTARLSADGIHILVCGSKDHVDNFVDALTKEVMEENLSLEPFAKDRDFRGVFRIIG